MRSKTHVILDSDILHEVDRIAGKRRRSLFIEEAVREKLEKVRFLSVLEDTKGAWSERRHPELKTSRAVSQYIREKRRSYHQRLKEIINEQVSS